MNILIFGGAGFIGTQLTRKYLDLGHHVTVVDDCSNALEHEIYIHQTYAKFNFIYNKIENILEIKFSKYSYDIIYHLASESRPLKFSEKYSKIISSNVYGLEQLLIWMKCFSPNAKLIYASSSEVYGDTFTKLSEDLSSIINPSYPRNVYSISKMLSESILQNRLDVDWNIVRFFNVYGPNNRNDDTKVIPKIIECLKYDKTFQIAGDGENRRSYTWIDDIVKGLLKVAEIGPKHEIYNLGRPYDYSINELIEIVRKFKFLKIEYVDERVGEPKMRMCCADNAHVNLNWFPTVSIEEGLEYIFKIHGII